ncbi:hypothetical protein F2Q69_00036237 [Brassica cretica]|uniref:Uncharacterized protein n=1 Tax=Brassica cretica TaxID=69181 RepID=A0A8S9SI39_BRACR|nr:hypothetical protein F2Q69_00036237 [Brassica cretica]
MDHSRCRLDVGCCRDSTRSLLWSHSECLEDLWDSFVAIKVLWTRGPAVSGTLSWSQVFLFCHLGCIFSKSGDYGNILLRSGGSRIYPPETWKFVKQQYFSVPMLGEYRRVPWKLVEARNLGNLERHVASASSRGEQPKIWNLGSGTWNLGPGTQREAEQQCSRRLGRVPYAEQVQSNLTSTLRRCIPLAIRLISDSTTT